MKPFLPPLYDAISHAISEPHIWKPAKEAYRFAVNALLLQPNEVMLVAVHPWDCHGALQVGGC